MRLAAKLQKLLKKALIDLQRSWIINAPTHRKQISKAKRNRKLLQLACAKLRKSSQAKQASGSALVIGDFSVNNGLGRAARYDIAALTDKHSSITAFDLTLREIASGPALTKFDTVYFFCQPDRLPAIADLVEPPAIEHSYRVGRFVWETPLFPREWLATEQVMHEIWTPSQYCADVFQSALHIPVSVVPHHVSIPNTAGLDLRPQLAVPLSAFLGVAIMDLRSCPARKNVLDHVKAWSSAFGPDASAQLIIKVRVSKRTAIDLDEARLEAEDCPNIHFISEEFSDQEIAALQQACDVYLSLHRAEGFGLNIQEALLLNKPVVATDWSANAEYGPNFKNYYPVSFNLVPYKDWTHSYLDDKFDWAKPNVAKAASLLRKIRADHTKRVQP